MPSSCASSNASETSRIWRRDSARAEVDRRADAGRAQVQTHWSTVPNIDLVERVRIGQQLVVVDLHDERDLVRVAARDRRRARRTSTRRRCSRPRSPARRCSRDRSRSGSARTTRRPSARCPGRPAGSRRSRCRRAGRGRTAPAGCAATCGVRSVGAKTRSTKSGPGRCSSGGRSSGSGGAGDRRRGRRGGRRCGRSSWWIGASVVMRPSRGRKLDSCARYRAPHRGAPP